jgi:tetratricopeptide (TPR) repeat protein
MLKKGAVLFLVMSALTQFVFSQNSGYDSSTASSLSRLQAGILLYGQTDWEGAVWELSYIDETAPRALRGEALFWRAQAFLFGEDYEGAIRDMEALETLDPTNSRIKELGYHKGRALFYLGKYDEAIVSFVNYIGFFGPDALLSSQDMSNKAAAYFWIGESLFAQGHFDRAEDIFSLITDNYPNSAKYEASAYRILLIHQKRIEAELLALLNWNHQESLLVMDEYQRRERAYDQAILSYQRSIAEMMSDSRMADLEDANIQYQRELAYADSRIRDLETRLAEATGTASVQRSSTESLDRLRSLRSSAVEMRDELQRALRENSGAGR